MARSSNEAKYRSIALATCEVDWLNFLLHELSVHPTASPSLLCDNVGATYVCMNPGLHSRMKHLAIDFHFVHERIAFGERQLADLLTKPLSRQRFQLLCSKISVMDGTAILRGCIKDN